MNTNSTNGLRTKSRGKAKGRMPAGLWVGRKIKSREQRAKIGCEDQLPGESREDYCKRVPLAFSPSFSWVWRRPGVPAIAEALDERYDTLEKARAYALQRIAEIRLREDSERMQLGRDLLDRMQRVQTGQWCSVGEYIEAVTRVLEQRNVQTLDRTISALRLILAVVQGWRVPFDRSERMDAALAAKVDGLPMSMICEETSDRFILLCQVAASVAVKDKAGADAINWTRRNPPKVNRTINSTLSSALVAFAKGRNKVSGTRVGEVMRLAVPWDLVDRFGARRLPVPPKDVGEEVPTEEEFLAMMEGYKQLVAEGNTELALVNEFLRKRGLRSGELTMARESWLVRIDGRWYLDVKDRPDEGFACKAARPGLLPMDDETVGKLKARCDEARLAGLVNPFLILPMLPGGPWLPKKQRNGELEARRKLVRDDHNAWVKLFLRPAPTGQGNHRLRKGCATRIYWAVRRSLVERGVGDDQAHEVAAREVKNFIRHESEATTLLHYIAPDKMRVSQHVTAAMIEEVLG